MAAESMHHSDTGQGTSLAERLCQQEPARASVHLIDWRVARRAGRACCCTAKPVVIAAMPPAHGRLHQTDLLLCGHHYRVSRLALTAAGAVMVDMAGTSLGPEEWPDADRDNSIATLDHRVRD